MADEEIRDEVEELEDVDEEIVADPREKQLQDKEKMIGRQSTEIGELRRQLDEARMAQMNQQNYAPAPATEGDPYEQVNSQFWENPGMTAAQMIQAGVQQALQTSKMAQSNVKAAMSGLRSDPMFNKVIDEFEAELGRVDDQYLLNPASAQQTVEAIYDRVVGKVARRLVKDSNSDPTQRMQILESLGVAKPAASAEDSADAVSSKDMEMLKSMGITGKKLQSVVSRFTSTEEE